MGKRGLGRGLAALISDSAEGGEGQVREVPLEQVAPNPYQPRTLFDPLKLEELAASIRAHGVLQPVLLRPVGHERYQLVAGERRFRAAQAAGLTAIPALIKECSEREQLEMAVVENLQRDDIGPIEAARAFRRLNEEFGMTHEAISERVGKARSSITNVLGLLDLPEDIQDSVERGEISEGHGRALKQAKSEPLIRRAWQAVLKRGLSVRETEKLAKALAAGEPEPEPAPPSPPASATAGSGLDRGRFSSNMAAQRDVHEMMLMDELRTKLQTKVAIRKTTGGAGKIEIEFYSSGDLGRIMDILLAKGHRW